MSDHSSTSQLNTSCVRSTGVNEVLNIFGSCSASTAGGQPPERKIVRIGRGWL
jgi:hypothetical protein